jgi:DNA-binding GntR family transcriptional regulator
LAGSEERATATRTRGATRSGRASVGVQALRPLATPRSLAEDAADVIREQILAGGFRRGEHLVEARIARQLHVSRGPVREAFKLLRAEGLVDEEPRRGTFVVTLSAADVREVYDLRAAVEARAARRLAEARDPGAIAELRGLLDRIGQAAASGDRRAVSRNDLAFHEAICRLSGNSRLHAVFVRHAPALHAMLRLDDQLYPRLEDIADQHRPIVDAIAAGDPAAAADACSRHCEEAAALVAGYLEEISD